MDRPGIFERLRGKSVGVKICGITNPEDAEMCIAAGADALGFNFYSGSKRFIDLADARPWLKDVSSTVLRVAVMVNPTLEEASLILDEPFIDAIQLHGEESLDFCGNLSRTTGKIVVKAMRVSDLASLKNAEKFSEFPILLDAFSAGERGGTGHTFDWKLLENLASTSGIILSGGLKSDNVREAIGQTGVCYVDVASGVESDPRRKNREKVFDLIFETRRTA